MVYIIKFLFIFDGMKVLWNKDVLKEKINDCVGEFVLCLLCLKVVIW